MASQSFLAPRSAIGLFTIGSYEDIRDIGTDMSDRRKSRHTAAAASREVVLRVAAQIRVSARSRASARDCGFSSSEGCTREAAHNGEHGCACGTRCRYNMGVGWLDDASPGRALHACRQFGERYGHPRSAHVGPQGFTEIA